jgi:hypothetical protein
MVLLGGGVGAVVIGDVRAVSAGLAVAAAAGALIGAHNLFRSVRRAERSPHLAPTSVTR